jgi:Arc/MetJ-type ribon-helix-helix transcriptional regulator
MMYGMRKTTVYLPDVLKDRLAALARRERRSEADLVREAVERLTSERPPAPRIPLVRDSGAPTDLAENDEAYLAGFGED